MLNAPSKQSITSEGLVTIADSGSMASAGRLLHLSPAALSLHVAELERRIGGRLLVRHARGVSLNEAGRGLVDHARRILTQCQEAEEIARTLARDRSKRLRVVALTSFILEMLPRVVNGEHPSVDPRLIDFVVTEAPSALQMLYADDVDLAIVTKPRQIPNEDFAMVALCTLPLAAYRPCELVRARARKALYLWKPATDMPGYPNCVA
jgi:DNA-binding transcriptional LysR family regulator